MSEWVPLGPHRYRVEGDLLFWCPNGEVLSEHAQGVCMLFDKVVERYGYVLWLVDARRSVPIGHDSRLVYARWFEGQTHSRLFVASFGAAIPARTTASLILRGIRLRQGITIDMECCLTEPEARAYLDGHRQSLRGAVA